MSKDEIIETEIGILKSAPDLTPMDKGECKKVMDAWLKSQVESITDEEMKREIKDAWISKTEKKMFIEGAKWMQQTLLNKIK